MTRILLRPTGLILTVLSFLIALIYALAPSLPRGEWDMVIIAATSSRSGTSQNYVVDAERELVLPLAITGRPASWSPDGQRIVYTSFHDDLITTDAFGKHRTRLRSDFSAVNVPIWSPDGSRIAFLSGLREQRLHILSLTGEGVWPVGPEGTVISNYSWSPDGREIVFGALTPSSRGSRFNLFAVDVETGHVRRLTTTPNHDRNPVWSPDGAQIAFLSDRFNLSANGLRQPVQAQPEVYTMNLLTGAVRRITEGGANALYWSADGQRMVYYQSQTRAFYRVDDSNTPPSPLITLPDLMVLHADWRPHLPQRLGAAPGSKSLDARF
jgi:Tol biopolymer transport system component